MAQTLSLMYRILPFAALFMLVTPLGVANGSGPGSPFADCVEGGPGLSYDSPAPSKGKGDVCKREPQTCIVRMTMFEGEAAGFFAGCHRRGVTPAPCGQVVQMFAPGSNPPTTWECKIERGCEPRKVFTRAHLIEGGAAAKVRVTHLCNADTISGPTEDAVPDPAPPGPPTQPVEDEGMKTTGTYVCRVQFTVSLTPGLGGRYQAAGECFDEAAI